MKIRISCVVAFLLGVALTGCADDTAKEGFSFKEQAEFDQPTSSDDLCDVYNFYGDGQCDDWCVEPDPDCDGGPGPSPDPSPDPIPDPDPTPDPDPDPTPDPDPNPDPMTCLDTNAANVRYVSESPEECQLIDFGCPQGWDGFDDAECGCGCVVPACSDMGDCGAGESCIPYGACDEGGCVSVCLPTICGLPGSAACREEPNCRDDQVIAEVNNCFVCVDPETCGDTQSMCAGDTGCPDGYCSRETAQCVYPNCSDQQPVLCDAERPDCGPGLISAARGGCWECLDPRTCDYLNVDG